MNQEDFRNGVLPNQGVNYEEMNVYIAASFACDSRELTEKRKAQIEDVVYILQSRMPRANFYVPHKLVIKNAWEMSLVNWACAVYEEDVKHLSEADLVIFISFGKHNNAGSAWECGYATGKGIPVIMICMTNNTESVMLYGSAHAIISESYVIDYDWRKMPKQIIESMFNSKYSLS